MFSLMAHSMGVVVSIVVESTMSTKSSPTQWRGGGLGVCVVEGGLVGGGWDSWVGWLGMWGKVGVGWVGGRGWVHLVWDGWVVVVVLEGGGVVLGWVVGSGR